ncbi:MAG TPA: FAD-dependent oxidoreductase, partial [Thermoanaerobaculia bacterium]|nr:FAD-dependent oxidoreductase [Thermoanaerobaculia bacterium]
MVKSYDVVIVGGGIVGLAIARELKHRDSSRTIAIIDKEPELGLHASGRNSGVLHSGIYYPPDSLKARFCSDGARELKAYCDEHSLPIDRCGKVIVATREADDPQLDVLASRAQANGARAEVIDASGLAEIEPEARTASGRALFVPDTSVVDPKRIVLHLAAVLHETGVDILTGSPVTAAGSSHVVVGQEKIAFGIAVNAAGLQADRIARMFGVGERYTMLPFKGIYYRVAENSPVNTRRLIYRVPDMRVPFLGVHFTKMTNGATYVGPTAI